jgi:pyruvate kinase
MMQAVSLRRAKILCTLGPASSSPEMIGKLIDSGMDAVRLNCSHGSHEVLAQLFATVREQASLRDRAVTILADLQGPKIRIGRLPEAGLPLEDGGLLVLSVDPESAPGPGRATIDYPRLATEAKVGDRVLMDDGELDGVIEAIEGPELRIRMMTGGILHARKGVNLPGTTLTQPALTPKDEVDLRFVLELGVDMVALSFVRRPDDLQGARAIMNECGLTVPLLAKLEKPEAVDNLDAIVDAADGIMVARGDLGVEMGPHDVPMIQKRAIETCNARGKLVITATQMLDSMIRNPRPTRAEASDVANAILDGSDAVMLSGETATGKYPVQSVQTMDQIIRRTEEADRYWFDPPEDMRLGHTTNAIARAAVSSSRSMPDTKAIVTYTGSGGIARLVSDYRPRVPIYAFTPQPETFQALSLYWGVVPILFSPSSPGGESIFIDLDQAMLRRGLLSPGDRVVIALGWPIKAKTPVNLIKVHKVGEALQGPQPRDT